MDLKKSVLLLFCGAFHCTLPCLPDCKCEGDKIKCDNGQYKDLPRPVDSVTSLTMVNNSFTQLDMLDITQWNALNMLNLTDNNILTVIKSSEDVSPHQSLVSLDLSRNSLQVLHIRVFSDFPCLEYLNLSRNHLHTLSDGTSLPVLKHLHLEYNHLQEIPSLLLASSAHLHLIQLSHNRISRLTGNNLN